MYIIVCNIKRIPMHQKKHHFFDIACKSYKALKLHFVCRLKWTPIIDVQRVYILTINMYMLWRIYGCWFWVDIPLQWSLFVISRGSQCTHRRIVFGNCVQKLSRFRVAFYKRPKTSTYIKRSEGVRTSSHSICTCCEKNLDVGFGYTYIPLSWACLAPDRDPTELNSLSPLTTKCTESSRAASVWTWDLESWSSPHKLAHIVLAENFRDLFIRVERFRVASLVAWVHRWICIIVSIIS